MDDINQDVYVAQLKAVFDTCDANGAGYLNKAELVQLCKKLNIEDQTHQLIYRLLGSKQNGVVYFKEFKEGFIQVLSESVDGLQSDEGDTEEDDDGSEMVSDEDGNEMENGDVIEPKYVNGEKKYGRRSRPDLESECSMDSGNGSSNQNGMKKDEHHKDEPAPAAQAQAQAQAAQAQAEAPFQAAASSDTQVKVNSASPTPEDEAGMFEAEGELNMSGASTMSMPGTGGEDNEEDLVSGEEEHLRDIWRELEVGQDGFLTPEELAIVCHHIGMEDMDDDELNQLFSKLDEDCDGRVSFDEFLSGLFQHGSKAQSPVSPERLTPIPTLTPTPSANTPTMSRPVATPRAKVRLSVAESLPLANITQGPTMFSALDTNGSGYAKAHDLAEYWVRLGVPDSAAVLQDLQIPNDEDVNLAELSGSLESILQSAEIEEDASPCFRAAVSSCMHELSYLRGTVDHMTREREKMKLDLVDANSRNAMLVKESDERHASLERSCSTEINSMENQYLDQLKQLQESSLKEKHLITQLSVQQSHELEQEIDRLKTEELQLKEKLAQTQRELELLEAEILELTERCAQLEQQNEKQHQELEVAADVQAKLEEMETQQNLLQDERERFTQQKTRKKKKVPTATLR